MEKYCRFSGRNIHYSISGTGDPLILLHGFLEDLTLWEPLVKHFTAGNTVICIDLPGHGKTDVFGEVHSMNLMADVVAAVMKSEGLRKAVVAGHSLGGYVALAFARRYLDLCPGIALLNSSADPDSEEKKTDRLRSLKIVGKNLTLFVNEAIPRMFAAQNTSRYKDDMDRIKKMALNTPVDGIIATTLGMMERENSRPFLSNPPVPVLFIAGKNDSIIPESKSLEQIAAGEKIRGVMLENSGHLSLIEEMDAVIFLLKSFLEELKND